MISHIICLNYTEQDYKDYRDMNIYIKSTQYNTGIIIELLEGWHENVTAAT